MDRFISNRAPRRLLLIFLIMLALSCGISYFSAKKCADIIVSEQIKAELSAVGGGKFTGAPEESSVAEGEAILEKYSISRELPPAAMHSYGMVRKTVFSLMFGLLAGVSLLWFVISVREVMAIFRDLEKLRNDCIKAAYDTQTAITLYGEDLGTVHRVCESAEKLVECMRNTSFKLSREQEFLRNFLTDLSHQIKTALAVVRLNTDMLSELDDLPAERRDKLSDEVQLNLDGMESLVIEAIKLAKLDTNTVEYRMEVHRISDVFALAVKRISPLLRKRNIRINAELPEDISLVCDKGWLCEAIENIIKNSADHSECTEITAELTKNPIMTTLAISDNGKGIPQEEIPKLFDRFSKKSQDSSMYSSGLGMSIAQKIVRGNNGEIFVYSEVGKGTRFEFVFITSGSSGR
ncbi:MAG: HAMP domain-containing histidine kinase [Ruminococcus sp.]|uniref:sensor histidine kinase n=1 Tax=Ruminococcus sp. TaxID=41978 RepID=UPI0025DEE889|nr:HAMP domain-containing sensor histidine kinase [Ruminococcus sp.]MBR5682708.1 HAMP domain-containing histidine kinase [Ruminococcus sp.]